MSPNQFIDQCIIPAFIGSYDQNIIQVIFRLDGTIAFATNKYSQLFGYADYLEFVGKSNTELFKIPEVNKVEFQQIIEEVRIIKHLVIINKKPQDFILMGATQSSPPDVGMFEVTYIPIFTPEFEVAGIQAITRRYTVLPQKSLFRHVSSNPVHAFSSQVILSQRQSEILLLLISGFSQYQIANMLKISRGTIAKIIAEDICPKFDISSNSAVHLVEKVLDMKLNIEFPESFIFPRIIILDYNVISA